MTNLPAWHVFGLLYHQAGRTFLAQVQALDAGQAVEVFWQKVLNRSPLIAESGEIAVEAVDDRGPAADVPFPEALPDHPALLAVAVLEKRGP